MTDEELLKLIDAASEPDPVLRVIIPSDTYRKALSFVLNVPPKRTTLPVLQMAHCSSNGHTTITTNDLEIFASIDIHEKAEVDGQVLIPRQSLLNAFKNSKRSVTIVTIDLKPKVMVDLIADGVKQTVPGMKVCEAVPLPRFELKRSLKVSASAFKEALKKVELAMSTDATRYVLNGVLLEFTPIDLALVATDGRRLHKVEMVRSDHDQEWEERIKQLEANAKASTKAKEIAERSKRYGVIIHSGTITQLLKMPLAPCDIMDIWLDEDRMAQFKYDCLTLTCKLIEGNYPNYPQVIPSENNRKLTVEADKLSAAVAQAGTLTTEKENSVKLTLTRDKITVSVKSTKGECNTEVPAEYKDQDMCIALNPTYLIEGLSAFKGLKPQIQLQDELCPIKITLGNTLAVIMPMRLS